MMQKPLAKDLSTSPGVYQYKDKNNKIIYVGKAINLRKRIFSYFRPEHTLTSKTALMLSHAVSIETIVTTTEKEALLLEASLIKKHKPRYNILLRDDKQYVLYKFSIKDPYPRLEIVRTVKKDGAKYFGPFTSGGSAKETWKNIHRLFPLRRCSDKAFNNRIRPCLYHYIGQCLAPCTQDVSLETYAKIVEKVRLLLTGKSKQLREDIEKAMFVASEKLDFEQAAVYRDQLEALEKTLEKQSVVLPEGGDLDILGLVQSKYGLSLGIVFVRSGTMIDSRSFHWQGLAFEEAHELIFTFLAQYYATAYIPQRIILPFMPQSIEPEMGENVDIAKESEGCKDEINRLAHSFTELRAAHLEISADKLLAQVRIRLAKNNEENKLVEIAIQNAREALIKKEEKSIGEILAPYFHTEKSIERIECVDVSHTFGVATKVGMVVFEKGLEEKEAYRAWNIDAEGDDYLALSKWAKLRIKRTMEGKAPFPDLLLIDGGKGQLSAVHKALLEEYKKIIKIKEAHLPFLLASIAKARDEDGNQDRRAGNVSDRIFVPHRTNPLNMKAGSQELLYLQKIRDAAHNYSIKKHRKARTRLALESELQRLPQVGEKTIQALWAHFNSLEEILAATPEQLAQVPKISIKRAKELHEKLQTIIKE